MRGGLGGPLRDTFAAMSESTGQFERVIQRPRGVQLNLRELWAYRELLRALAWRSILARYKQTVMGVLWAVIRPVVTMVVFTLVFHNLAGLESGAAPYALMALAGVLPWQLFSQSVTGCTSSVVTNAEMIRKVYFPRLAIPASACAVALVDFMIGLAVVAVAMVIYAQPVTWQLAVLPLWVLLGLVAALGPGLWLSALNVRYRDVAHLVPFIISVGLFITPVGYAPTLVPEQWRWAYALNPMVGVIEGFRWSLLGSELDAAMLGISAGVAAVLFVSGVAFYQTMQRAFADVI